MKRAEKALGDRVEPLSPHFTIEIDGLSDDSLVHFSDHNDEEIKQLTGKFPSFSKDDNSLDKKLTTNETLHEVEMLSAWLKYAEDENQRL